MQGWTTRRPRRCATCSSKWSSDRKSTRLNSSHDQISYAVFCLKKKKKSVRSEEPTSELPSRSDLVCPLLHEKTNKEQKATGNVDLNDTALPGSKPTSTLTRSAIAHA